MLVMLALTYESRSLASFQSVNWRHLFLGASFTSLQATEVRSNPRSLSFRYLRSKLRDCTRRAC